MHLIDTHVHLNFETFEPDLDAVAQRWRDAGVVQLVHSCVTPSEFPAIQALSQRFPELFFAVGLHPLDVSEALPGWEADVQAWAASDAKVVAIGETGLDFYKADNREPQVEAFWAHLRIAQQLNLPVIIHCRDAAETMVDCLHQFWQQHGPVKGVMHCWGGTADQAQWFIDLGFYISFSGTVTFKNATQIHESAKIVPSERLLIETDCPFLSPVPKRGERRNEPANVLYVAQRLAELRGSSLEDLTTQTTLNARQLFQLPQPAVQPLARV
ncbi:MAG TPA: TatD family hydrolase [Stenomitos sp.]